ELRVVVVAVERRRNAVAVGVDGRAAGVGLAGRARLADAVAADLARSGVDGRIAVVAVAGLTGLLATAGRESVAVLIGGAALLELVHQPVAVVVDPVADLELRGVHLGVGVVAVGAPVGALRVAVAVEIAAGVGAVAVLVDAVVADVDGARVDRLERVVAVAGAGRHRRARVVAVAVLIPAGLVLAVAILIDAVEADRSGAGVDALVAFDAIP